MMGCGPKKRRRKSRTKRKDPQSGRTSGASPTSVLMPRVPQKCFNCGASIHTEKVNWIGPDKIECPYCGQALNVDFEKVA
ncbi:MAG: hypothetical protein ACW979_15475 [Candidatus Thorarchaeota archaeon]|jgi:DNA-directed RNA polymerase subunit RPC12/RpoP